MTDLQERETRYRRLFGRLTPDEARNLIDRLQVLALTRPDTVRELETFFERDAARRERQRRPHPRVAPPNRSVRRPATFQGTRPSNQRPTPGDPTVQTPRRSSGSPVAQLPRSPPRGFSRSSCSASARRTR